VRSTLDIHADASVQAWPSGRISDAIDHGNPAIHHESRTSPMNKTLITAAFAALSLLAPSAFAANAACEAQAAEKKLAGAAKTSFMKKCESDAAAAAPVNAACEKSAAEKKLAGAAKTSFMKKCEADAAATAPVSPACEKSAAEMKLAGAAKTSHIKKCMADEAAAKK
jgi:hypothetical protein